MPLEASVERITLNSRGNGENIQLLTEGDMIVPDINPDIYQILKADEDIIIDTVKAGQGRVSFSGRLCVTVLYCGKKTEQPVSFMKAEFPIEDYIMSDGITEESDTDIMTEIIHSDYRLVNDRKINVRAVSRISQGSMPFPARRLALLHRAIQPLQNELQIVHRPLVDVVLHLLHQLQLVPGAVHRPEKAVEHLVPPE